MDNCFKDASSALKNFKSKDEFITGDVLKEPSTASLDSLDTTSISCPESGKFQCEQPNCGKSFRKLTLLLHHTKHYHKNSDLMDEQVSKSCSADVLAKQLKERRSLGTNIVARKRKVDVQEAFTSPGINFLVKLTLKYVFDCFQLIKIEISMEHPDVKFVLYFPRI